MADPRTLFLHLGPPKTGSTFVQTAFELSRGVLAERGIDYPTLLGSTWTGEGGSIYGNYVTLFEELERARGGSRHLLVSGESLVSHLADPLYVELLDRLRREAGFTLVRGLLFPRDPVPHAAASYQQRVKNTGTSDTVEDSFATFELTSATLRLVRDLEQVGAVLTLRGYVAVRPRLLEVVEEWLGLPPVTLVRPGRAVVNRSMTRSELALQSRLNASLAPARRKRLLTPLVERLPDLPAHQPLPAVSRQQELLDRVAPDVTELNSRLPEDERLVLGVLPVVQGDDDFVFTGPQLDELARSVAEEIECADPFSRWRARIPFRLGAMVVRTVRRAADRVRGRSPRGLEPNALRLTRTRGSARRSAEAAVLLAAVSPLRRVLPQRRFARWVGPLRPDTSPFPPPVRAAGAEREVMLAVRTAARWLPFGTDGFDHAVTGSLLLSRRGVPSEVVLCHALADPGRREAGLVTANGLLGAAASRAWVPVARFGPRPGLES